MILHEAIIGSMRANGETLNAWCVRNGINKAVARNAAFGQSRGPAGRALLMRLVAAADQEFVERAYAKRLADHVASFTEAE